MKLDEQPRTVIGAATSHRKRRGARVTFYLKPFEQAVYAELRQRFPGFDAHQLHAILCVLFRHGHHPQCVSRARGKANDAMLLLAAIRGRCVKGSESDRDILRVNTLINEMITLIADPPTLTIMPAVKKPA